MERAGMTLEEFRNEWFGANPEIAVRTSGSTGEPKTLFVAKERMRGSALRTCRFLNLPSGCSALLCMPLDFIAGKMMAVRAFVGNLRLICVEPSSRPLADLEEIPYFVAMTPMQVFETLAHPDDLCALRKVKNLIIGGGSVPDDMATRLRTFPNAVFSTYGMTETLSHIAMRRLSGTTADDAYTPLSGVSLSLDNEGCLIVSDPVTNPAPLHTNDRAELLSDGRFRLLGRRDNVVCSGGVKLQIEQIEERLANLPCDFLLTALPHPKFGEALVMLYAGNVSADVLETLCRQQLSRYEVPKLFLRVNKLPLTPTGKPARAQARMLAAEQTRNLADVWQS